MSFKESAPLLTRESATAPLNALEVLAGACGRSTRMGRPLFRLRTPKAWTSLCLPRCTTAMAPGGPPCLATSAFSAPSSAASAPLAPWPEAKPSLPEATVFLPAR